MRRLRLAAGVAMLLLGGGLLMMPLADALATRPAAANLHEPRQSAQLERAHTYNQRLLDQPNLSVGEAPDPFVPGSTRPAHADDDDYQSQLGSGDDMAALRIPRIGVNLRVAHGTAAASLEQGAGHVYGTSLPVGDEGVSVIAAHRGLGLRLLLYRLDELSEGDVIYTAAAGDTFAWSVERVRRVLPGSDEERELIEQRRGVRRLVLYTCDPPGLNTQRLIVVARSVPRRQASATPRQSDPWRLWALAAGVPALIAPAVVFGARRLRRGRHRSVRNSRRFRQVFRRSSAGRARSRSARRTQPRRLRCQRKRHAAVDKPKSAGMVDRAVKRTSRRGVEQLGSSLGS